MNLFIIIYLYWSHWLLDKLGLEANDVYQRINKSLVVPMLIVCIYKKVLKFY